jgi:hypothetical protein
MKFDEDASSLVTGVPAKIRYSPLGNRFTYI